MIFVPPPSDVARLSLRRRPPPQPTLGGVGPVRRLEACTGTIKAAMSGHRHAVVVLQARMDVFKASALGRTDWLRKYFSVKDPAHIPDERDGYGRTPLMVAATYNQLEACEVLLDAGAEPGLADQESGWTALHRAAYWGCLRVMDLLSQHGAPDGLADRDGLTAADILTWHCRGAGREREEADDSGGSGGDLVLSWGANNNMQLGHLSDASQAVPRVVEGLKGQVVRGVAVSSFHAVAWTEDGAVYTWGVGRHGRLGHGSEASNVLPRRVEALEGHAVTAAAVGAYHTLVVTATGELHSFGSPRDGVLGYWTSDMAPQVTPRRVTALKEATVVNASASKTHSLALSSAGHVYAFGCGERGQLGHALCEKSQTPRRVEGLLNHKVVGVVASDGYTGVWTALGDALVIGGGTFLARRLAIPARPQVEVARRQQTRMVAVRQLVVGMSLGPTEAYAITDQGYCYMSALSSGERKEVTAVRVSVPQWCTAVAACDQAQVVGVVTRCGRLYLGHAGDRGAPRMERVPHVRGASSVHVSPIHTVAVARTRRHITGESLLSESTFRTDIAGMYGGAYADMELMLEGGNAAVHRVILEARSPAVMRDIERADGDTPRYRLRPGSRLSRAPAPAVRALLQRVYGCDQTEDGPDARALARYYNLDVPQRRDSGEDSGEDGDPAANHTVVSGHGLQLGLGAVLKRTLAKEFPGDFVIVGADGECPCHRGVLAARSEYFGMMLGSGMMESGGRMQLSDVPAELIEEMLLFLYTDTDRLRYDLAPSLVGLADALLLSRMKEICLLHLRHLIDHRNCVSFLEVAHGVESENLLAYASGYICDNVDLLYLSGALGDHSDDTALMEEVECTVREALRLELPVYICDDVVEEENWDEPQPRPRKNSKPARGNRPSPKGSPNVAPSSAWGPVETEEEDVALQLAMAASLADCPTPADASGPRGKRKGRARKDSEPPMKLSEFLSGRPRSSTFPPKDPAVTSSSPPKWGASPPGAGAASMQAILQQEEARRAVPTATPPAQPARSGGLGPVYSGSGGIPITTLSNKKNKKKNRRDSDDGGRGWAAGGGEATPTPTKSLREILDEEQGKKKLTPSEADRALRWGSDSVADNRSLMEIQDEELARKLFEDEKREYEALMKAQTSAVQNGGRGGRPRSASGSGGRRRKASGGGGTNVDETAGGAGAGSGAGRGGRGKKEGGARPRKCSSGAPAG